MDIEYSLLSRQDVVPANIASLGSWDLLISAFNISERVTKPFELVQATEKHWLIHPEYDLDPADLPASGQTFRVEERDEADFWHGYLDSCGADSWHDSKRICVDVTGMMRPHLMLMPRIFRERGFSRLDVLYSEPVAYESGDKTPFSKGAVTQVRQVRGLEGTHLAEPGDRDLLIIGSGYDDVLIRRVADSKRSARKLEMFGLPSLQPHMYEENQLQAAKAEEAVGRSTERSSRLFAPANDPFATAQELHDRIEDERAMGVNNLYLSPLATKPQALGFALYFLTECVNQATSVIFPFAEYYSKETSIGWARTSKYCLELDWFGV